jgi:hypothetical protein
VPRTEIDIPAVVAIGAKVSAVAGDKERAAAEIEGWAYQGQDAVPGSDLCLGQLSNAAYSWANGLTEMAASVRTYGGDLKVTAEAYAAYDRMSAQELRQATR